MTEAEKLKLIVIMSALNEESTIGDVIDAIPGDMGLPVDVTVIVVDDGSGDRTGAIAAERGAIVLRHEERLGLGASFGDAMERALAEAPDLVVNIDADGQFDPAGIPDLIRPIMEGRADFVTVTRFARRDLMPEMPWIRKWGNRQMCRLVNWATGRTKLTDVSCGFRAYSAKAALSLHLSGRFTHTQETIIELARKGLRIAEVPMKVRGVRLHGKSRVAHSLPHYALRAGGTVMRTMCRTRPFFFGALGWTVMGLGVLQGLAVFINWLFTRMTHPIKALLTGSAVFITVGAVILVLALVADMLDRIIDVQEKTAFLARLKRHEDLRARRKAANGKAGDG